MATLKNGQLSIDLHFQQILEDDILYAIKFSIANSSLINPLVLQSGSPDGTFFFKLGLGEPEERLIPFLQTVLENREDETLYSIDRPMFELRAYTWNGKLPFITHVWKDRNFVTETGVLPLEEALPYLGKKHANKVELVFKLDEAFFNVPGDQREAHWTENMITFSILTDYTILDVFVSKLKEEFRLFQKQNLEYFPEQAG